MVWVALSYNGKADIISLNGRQTSPDCIKSLGDILRPITEDLVSPNSIFLHLWKLNNFVKTLFCIDDMLPG